MTRWRPCGACRELVPDDAGCEHWKPGASVKAEDSRARRNRQRNEVERFRRMMTREARG